MTDLNQNEQTLTDMAISRLICEAITEYSDENESAGISLKGAKFGRDSIHIRCAISSNGVVVHFRCSDFTESGEVSVTAAIPSGEDLPTGSIDLDHAIGFGDGSSFTNFVMDYISMYSQESVSKIWEKDHEWSTMSLHPDNW